MVLVVAVALAAAAVVVVIDVDDGGGGDGSDEVDDAQAFPHDVAKLIIYNIVLLFICHNKRSSSSSSTFCGSAIPHK